MSRPRVRGRRPAGTDEVYRVTDARRPHSDDQHSRTVKYLVSMSIRMVCFVLVLVTPSPWRWFFVAGAVVLPYIAVVIANAGVEQRPSPLEAVAPSTTPRLEQRGHGTNEPGGR